MDTIKINPLVVSVGPASDSAIFPIIPTEHGGGAKKALAVVGAIVIPFAAPMIASAIGLSGAVTAAATTVVGGTWGAAIGGAVGGAIVGAGLGAITAAVSGQSVKAGAISGGFSGALAGGISGYRGATAPVSTGEGATADAVTNQGYGQSSNITNVSYSSDPLIHSVSDTVTTPVADGSTWGDMGAKFLESAKKVPSLVVDKITDPSLLADLTMQAGAMLIGGMLAPSPYLGEDPEMQQLVQDYRAELSALKARDEEAFNQKMAAAQQYLVQANYYDPSYFASLGAKQAMISGARKLDEEEKAAAFGGKSLSQGTRAGLVRQTALDAATAFNRDFTTAMDRQSRLTTAGLNVMGEYPDRTSSYFNYSQMLQAEKAKKEAAATAARTGITDFFGKFNIASGSTEEQDSKKADPAGQEDEDEDDFGPGVFSKGPEEKDFINNPTYV